jgi:hypothetical protein
MEGEMEGWIEGEGEREGGREGQRESKRGERGERRGESGEEERGEEERRREIEGRAAHRHRHVVWGIFGVAHLLVANHILPPEESKEPEAVELREARLALGPPLLEERRLTHAVVEPVADDVPLGREELPGSAGLVNARSCNTLMSASIFSPHSLRNPFIRPPPGNLPWLSMPWIQDFAIPRWYEARTRKGHGR